MGRPASWSQLPVFCCSPDPRLQSPFWTLDPGLWNSWLQGARPRCGFGGHLCWWCCLEHSRQFTDSCGSRGSGSSAWGHTNGRGRASVLICTWRALCLPCYPGLQGQRRKGRRLPGSRLPTPPVTVPFIPIPSPCVRASLTAGPCFRLTPDRSFYCWVF